MPKSVLATGGAGYIGSHVVVELVAAGYDVVVLDNFENSSPCVVGRLSELTGREIELVQADVRNRKSVEYVLDGFEVDAVIHLAGKKAVGESVENPLLYFDANLNGAISLLEAMQACGVHNLVFSSSATVYGVPEVLPIREGAATSATNPYGRTKLMIEEIISDVVASDADFRAISLRYFNPVGAHESGMIGEDPKGIPNNLFPYVAQTAAGERSSVQVFGGDYETADGTGLRDYIHVTDLAKGHVAALDRLLSGDPPKERHQKINLGTGEGHTVLEVIRAFSQACGSSIPYEVVGRRSGDVAASVADAGLALDLLGWRAIHDLRRMCRDHWRFQSLQSRRNVALTKGNPGPRRSHLDDRLLHREVQ